MSISKNNKTIILILIAFAFSFALRLIWVYQFSDASQFKFNNEFMINTNDGYYYAEGARDILKGISINTNDLSPINSATSILTALIAKIFPISFETIIFYMPAFFSSLLVIPIILIGRSLKSLEIGFIAALLSSIAWSYYNRTMVGYYDTDLLNIVFPTFLLWSLIWAIKTKQDKYLIFTALDIIAYRWWYPQSYALEFAFFSLIFIYFLYEFFKIKKKTTSAKLHILNPTYTLSLLTFMMLGMIQFDGYIRFFIVIIFFIFIKIKKELVYKYIYYIFAFSIFLFLISGGLDPIIARLKAYVFKDIVSVVQGEELKLHYYTVMKTIREAGSISFETFANRISGHTIIFFLSLIGFVLLTLKQPIMLLALPMIGLGFLANGFFGLIGSGGLRFTIYAIPPFALGIAFLIVYISDYIKNNILKYTLMSILTVLILLPNIIHITKYKVPTVFTKDEVKVLDKLKNIASREDYVVGWWDYGYPIRYYADVKTLSDGGKHSGFVNFPTSFILTNSQEVASKMLRLDVEYTESNFKIIKENGNLSKENKRKINTNITQMTLDYKFDDTNDFLYSLQTDIKLPKKTRDIYLYLPNRMLNIYPTVQIFSNLDLMSGIQKKRPFFYKSQRFNDTKDYIDLGNNIKVLKKSGEIQLGNKKVKINKFAITQYSNNKLNVNIQKLNAKANYNVIFMRNYNQILIVDNATYNSTYFQLYVFEKYNKDLFEEVILTPLVKVYKLKI